MTKAIFCPHLLTLSQYWKVNLGISFSRKPALTPNNVSCLLPPAHIMVLFAVLSPHSKISFLNIEIICCCFFFFYHYYISFFLRARTSLFCVPLKSGIWLAYIRCMINIQSMNKWVSEKQALDMACRIAFAFQLNFPLFSCFTLKLWVRGSKAKRESP